MPCEWSDKIFNVSVARWEALVLEIFQYQYRHNEVYRAYAQAVHRGPEQVRSIQDIPFLPIEFFKSHRVCTSEIGPYAIFESSGTTGSSHSYHYVQDISLYERSFLSCFERFYGPVGDWCIIGLLPSYLERKGSSLVYMVDRLVRESHHPLSGFYLDDFATLQKVLRELEASAQPSLLFGVTFALLDFSEQYAVPLRHTQIVETGGMKGRKKEMIREEVHAILNSRFGTSAIGSEYGMTELLSQAYSQGGGRFHCPPWMQVLVRDDEDPLDTRTENKSAQNGVLNIIDLANVYSCPFIATQDVGRVHPDGSFEVLGRLDGSDIRGCSLMVVS